METKKMFNILQGNALLCVPFMLMWLAIGWQIMCHRELQWHQTCLMNVNTFRITTNRQRQESFREVGVHFVYFRSRSVPKQDIWGNWCCLCDTFFDWFYQQIFSILYCVVRLVTWWPEIFWLTRPGHQGLYCHRIPGPELIPTYQQ